MLFRSQEFNSVRAMDFLRTLVIRRLGAFKVAKGRPRSREHKVFPYVGDAKFNAPRSRALLSLLDRHRCGHKEGVAT